MDAENEDIELKMEGVDMFVLVNGVKVARRAHKGTPQAKTWISLEPGSRVFDGPHATIAVEYVPPRVQ
jgi:hypothetical protein